MTLRWCGIVSLALTLILLLVYSRASALEISWIALTSAGLFVFMVGLIWTWIRAKQFGLSGSVYNFGLFACFFYATLSPSLIQEFYNKHQADYACLLNEARERNYNLAEIQFEHPSASFYMKRKVPVLMNYYDFAAFLALPPDRHAILLSEQYLPLIKDIPFSKEIDHRGRQYLFIAEDKKKVMLQHFYNMQQASH